VQYADETLVIMQADVQQLHHLKGLLRDFGAATSLQVNFAKSNLIPINIPESYFTTAL
jgi:hypothetical protein